MDKWVVSYVDRYENKRFFTQFNVKLLPYGKHNIDNTVMIFNDKDKATAVALLINGKVEEVVYRLVVSYLDCYASKKYFVGFTAITDKLLPYGEDSCFNDTVTTFDDGDRARAVALLSHGIVEEIVISKQDKRN